MGEWVAQLAGLFPETARHYAKCLKKLGYPSHEEADAVRQRRQALTDEVLRVYGPCEDCGFWHLTHTPLTAAQVLVLEDLIRMEIANYHVVWQHLQEAARPYVKTGRVYRKTPRDIDEDFARQLDLLEQAFGYWLCWFQRDHALRLAYATSADEARRVDRQGRDILDASLRAYSTGREDAIKLCRQWHTLAGQALNHAFALPSTDWRQHLTHE